MKMNLPNKLCFLGALSAMVFSLASCSPSSDGSESSDYKSKPLTVIFYDDAPTPQKIGYSYVKPGASALFPSHISLAADGGAYEGGYDYLSRSSEMPIGEANEPMRFVFDSFAGEYDDHTPVDLMSIAGDCNVYATFKKEAPVYTYTIQNGNATATYLDDTSKKVAYERIDSFPNLPVLPSDGKLPDNSYLTDSTLSWFEDDHFEGYTLSSKGKSKAGDAVEVDLDATIPSGSALALDPLGSEKGEANAKQFHFWVDDQFDSTLHCYPFTLYFSDGTAWHELGSLLYDFTFVFHVKYSDKEEKVFDAAVYANEWEAKHGGEAINASLKINYLEKITASNPTLNAGKYDTTLTGANAQTVSTLIEPESWMGFYTGNGDFKGDSFSFKDGESSAIQDDCSLFPVKKLRVHLYDSRANYELASTYLADLNPNNDEWAEYPELMYVNYSSQITFAQVGDTIVLKTSLGSTSLRFDNSALGPVTGFVCYNALGKLDGTASNYSINQNETDSLTASIVEEIYVYPTY